MSQQYNLAGKSIVVDSVIQTGKSTTSIEGIRGALETAKAKMQAKEIIGQVEETIDVVTDHLQDTIDTVASDLSDLTEDVNDNIKTAITTVTSDLSSLTTEVHDELEVQITTVSDDLSALTTEVHDELKVQINTVAGNLSTLTTEVTDKLDDTTGTVITGLNTLVDQVGGTTASGLKTLITNTGETLQTNINTVESDLTSSISTTASTLQGNLDSAVTTINGTITQTESDLKDYTDAAETRVNGTITQTEADLKDYTDNASATINQTITTKEGELKTYAEDRRDEAKSYADDLKDALDGDIADVASDLSDLSTDVTNLSGTVSTNDSAVTAVLRRVGARAVIRNTVRQIDVYCYNPRKPYPPFDVTDPDAYTDEYYSSAGYVNCDGQNYPVSITGNYTTFTPANHGGVWVIAIYLANAQDEAYTPLILCPYANGQVMEWRLPNNTALTSALLLNTWIIGSFEVQLTSGAVSGITNLTISQEGKTPAEFLRTAFMRIMGQADGNPEDDFTDWAIAMGCDQIYKRVAALELLVHRLYANNIQVGPGDGTTGSGFRFRAQTYDKTGTALTNPLFDVYYGNSLLFKVDISTGKIFFGTSFWYDPSDSAIHSTNDNILISSAGKLSASDVIINNASTGRADLGCAVFQAESKTQVPYAAQTNQGKRLFDAITDTYGITTTSSGDKKYSIWLDCYISDSSLTDAPRARFIRQVRQYFMPTYGQQTDLYGVEFADVNGNVLSSLTASRYNTSQSDVNPFEYDASIVFLYGGNKLVFKDLPKNTGGLEAGQVWNDNGVLKIYT